MDKSAWSRRAFAGSPAAWFGRNRLPGQRQADMAALSFRRWILALHGGGCPRMGVDGLSRSLSFGLGASCPTYPPPPTPGGLRAWISLRGHDGLSWGAPAGGVAGVACPHVAPWRTGTSLHGSVVLSLATPRWRGLFVVPAEDKRCRRADRTGDGGPMRPAPCDQRGPTTGSGRVPGSIPLRTGESARVRVKGMVWRGPGGGGSTPPPDRSSRSVKATGAPDSRAR